MTAKIFIDGEHGTTGLQIRTRLAGRRDIELLSIPEAERRNAAIREDMLNNADISILCLPDDASREAVTMVAGNNNVRIIDTSTAYRIHKDWAYGFAEMDRNRAKRFVPPASSPIRAATRPVRSAFCVRCAPPAFCPMVIPSASTPCPDIPAAASR